MHWTFRIGAGVLLALGAVTTAFAARTDGKTAATAVSLSTSSPAAGTLAGSDAGSFAFYTFDYPGDGSVGTITINVNSGDPSIDNAVGVNVYQGANTLATMNALGSPPGTNSVTFSSSTAGPVLVQVYNYNPGIDVSFKLGVSGVTAMMPMASPTPMAAATPSKSVSPTMAGESASNPIHLMKSASGSLPGNLAGSYAYYTVDYPGDGSTQSVTLTYSPGGSDVGHALFVNVFQDGNTLTTVSGDQASEPGQLTVDYSSTTAGPVLIQIANYNPSPTVSYTVSH